MWPKVLTFVLELRKNPGINLNQEIDPTGDLTWACGWEAMMLPLDHSGGLILLGDIELFFVKYENQVHNFFYYGPLEPPLL